MKMGKKVREYKAGDFIFAKVKGYPAWPARVQKPNGKKYFVYFYGTGETANLAPTMIFDYAENKDKFLSKAVKRRDFNDGVKQIEHDFANNVPLEQVIGLAMEVPEESANDTVNDSAANDTMDDTAVDTTAADDTTAMDESTANETASKEAVVEEPEEAASPVVDEAKQKGRKTPKPAAKETPKPAKEPRTPRGKKKDEAVVDDKEDDAAKKDEEIVSRSGRKIRPKRYMDEQTEENSTLPSPAPKKRRGGSPTADKEKDGDKTDKTEAKIKPVKHFNTVTQAELEDLKEPFNLEDTEKENILIAYLPSGQYVGVKLFQSRPASFKSEAARLQWDKQQAVNALTLKSQLEKGHITAQSVIAQLVMDLHLTDEEKATLDRERETEEKRSRVQFLKTEMKMIELEAKIKTCLCLEKADTNLCLALLDELEELDIKPLMLLKHPGCVETIKRMRAYVGNTPSWDLSESAALLFGKQAHMIRKQADELYKSMKHLFIVPNGLSFWEYFSERVLQFKKLTADLKPNELLELVHEPLGMTVPTSHTMKAAIDAANEEEESLEDIGTPRKKAKSKNNATTPKQAQKRQNARKQAEDKGKEKEAETEKEQSAEQPAETAENADKSKPTEAENISKDNEQTTAETANANEETTATEDKIDKDDSTKKNSEPEKPKDKEKGKEKSKSKSPSPNEKAEAHKSPKDRENGKSQKDSGKGKESKEDKGSKEEKSVKEKSGKEKSSKEDKAAREEKEEQKEKEKDDEPRAKRSRESKKTDGPPPRSPAKRKTKS